jgi:hypothetical protein
MNTINRLPSATATTQVTAVAGDPNAIPVWLRPLAAAHANVKRDYAADAGLRAFLDVNKASVVQWENAPKGKVVDKATWETWCHTTTRVPAAVRDEEYIVVVARGSAYDNTGNVKLPLQNGGQASADGRIVFVGKTSDFLHTQQKADEGGGYPGAITVEIEFPVAGDLGENVELQYARVKPNAQGQLHSSESGWPDGWKGVYGGFSGRNTTATIVGGRQEIDCPDGTSTRATAVGIKTANT